MNIDLISSVNSLQDLSKIGTSSADLGVKSTDDTYSFGNVLTDAIQNVQTTNDKVTEEAYKLATGQTDNLHDITIASTEANLAVQLFVQIRNKTVSAYQELMNLNI